MSDTDDLAVTVAALKVLAEYASAEYEKRRAEMAAALKRGDRSTARDPRDDGKIASISLTDPKPVVSINLPVLTEWVRREYPALCETVTAIAPGMEHPVIETLAVHAPHLLRQEIVITADALAELRANCVYIGAPVGPQGETDIPGIEVRTPAPSLQCRLTSEAKARVLDLVRTGRVQLDGAVRPAIEEAK